MKTLADLSDGVLATVNFRNLKGLKRYHVGDNVYDQNGTWVGDTSSNYIFVEVSYPTWEEVYNKGQGTIIDVLIQCLATINNSPGFTNLTLKEIFDRHCKLAKECWM